MILNELLEQLEATTNNLFSIESHFRKLSSQDVPDSLELLSEKMAFDFHPDYKHDMKDWNTYYGPQMVWNNNDGTASIWPHYKQITQQVIDYWTKRAFECKNPIMSGRYADLVWDFQYKCTQTNPSVEIAKKCINDYIAVANGRLSIGELDTYKCLERALRIALQINDMKLVQRCKDAIINYEEYATKDESPGLWGYSFDLLVLNKKVELSQEEENNIIQHLENILERVTQEEKNDVWAAENAIKMLAKYYSSKHDKLNLKRVLYVLEESHRITDKGKSAMQTEHWLKDISKYYNRYGFKDDEQRILIELRDISSNINEEMKAIPFECQITKEQIDSIVEPYLIGEIEDVLMKLSLGFIPIKQSIRTEVLESKNTLLAIVNTMVYDSRGRVLGSLGSIDENEERHVINKTGMHLRFSGMFLNLVWKTIIERRGNITEAIVAYLKESVVIESDRFNIVEQAVKAHFEGDYFKSVHLTIPQIEEAIRKLLEMSGGNVLVPNIKVSGYKLKTFDHLLQDEIVNKILGEDFVNYYRALFTDPFGWNLRNDTMHGYINPDSINILTSERVLHALMCLGLIRQKQP